MNENDSMTTGESLGKEKPLQAIYLKESKRYDVTLLGAILSQHLHLHLADATTRIRYCRGAFMKNVDPEMAEKLGKELREVEQDYFTLPMDQVISIHRIYNVGKVKIEEEGIRVFLSGYKEKLLEWEKIGALHFITLHKGEEVEEKKKKKFLMSSRDQQLTPKARDIMENLEILREKQYNPELFFDILYLEGPSIYRFYQKRLSYPFQKDIYPHSLDNFLALFEELASQIPEEKYTEETHHFFREMEKEALKREKRQEKKKASLKPEGSLIDRVRILDGTLYYKIEELQNYYDWLINRPDFRSQVLLPPKKKEEIWQPLTEQQTQSLGLKWPFIVGVLGSIYMPLFLYAFALYRHSQNKAGLPLDINQVQNLTLSISAVLIALISIGVYFKKISKFYIGSVILIACITIMTYPAVLLSSGEFHFRAKQQKIQILSQIQLFKQQKGRMPASLEEINGGRRVLDPWNHPWHFQVLPGGGFKLVSAGPDGKVGTKDDI
ncbi:MAG: hypothetical protein D6785_16270 [Planctomycetota bacterium]|nr:MAG: hypothetical protein D6785_16270 [Planctomycetota bacterium]